MVTPGPFGIGDNSAVTPYDSVALTSWPTTLLSLLVGIAGWYYLFYSRAANRLESLETASANRQRILFRRINGGLMIVLAALLYIGTRAIDPAEHRREFVLIWLANFVLLMLIVLLALIDVRLTVKLRAQQRREQKP